MRRGRCCRGAWRRWGNGSCTAAEEGEEQVHEERRRRGGKGKKGGILSQAMPLIVIRKIHAGIGKMKNNDRKKGKKTSEQRKPIIRIENETDKTVTLPVENNSVTLFTVSPISFLI